jgi:uncharacterized membrane protein
VNSEQDAAVRLLYQLMDENRQHARLSEDRRIVISCVTAVAASAVATVMALLSPSVRTLPLALWLVFLGLFGLLSCIKLYERAQLHERRARALRSKLVDLTVGTGVNELLAEAQAANVRQHPRFSAIRFNSILTGLNVGIVLLGVLYAALDVLYR